MSPVPVAVSAVAAAAGSLNTSPLALSFAKRHPGA